MKEKEFFEAYFRNIFYKYEYEYFNYIKVETTFRKINNFIPIHPPINRDFYKKSICVFLIMKIKNNVLFLLISIIKQRSNKNVFLYFGNELIIFFLIN